MQTVNRDYPFFAAPNETTDGSRRNTKQQVNDEGLSKAAESVFTYYHGNGTSCSSPAHWHKEAEIIHFISGTGFSHTGLCRNISFDAPAIIIVPAGMIHKTGYSASCTVSRMLFRSESLRLADSDPCVEKFLSCIKRSESTGSILLRAGDDGFDTIESMLHAIEALTPDDGTDTFYPGEAQEMSIRQDKVDDYVAATFANFGAGSFNYGSDRYAEQHAPVSSLKVSGSDRFKSYAAAERSGEAVGRTLGNYLLSGSYKGQNTASSSINSGSIAIAAAQSFKNTNFSSAGGSEDLLYSKMASGGDLHKGQAVDPSVNLQVKAMLLSFVAFLVRYGYCEESRKPQRKSRSTRYSDEKIKELLTYIHDNYNRQLSIKELSGIMSVTNQYFCRYFKQLTDMSFVDYINDLRLQRAARDIVNTNHSIREISVRHGFDTIGYFFKLFRDRYGTTPMSYRNSHKADREEAAEDKAAEKKSGESLKRTNALKGKAQSRKDSVLGNDALLRTQAETVADNLTVMLSSISE